jgi:hypothetical protein
MTEGYDPYNSNPHESTLDQEKRADDVLEFVMTDKDKAEANDMFRDRITRDAHSNKPAKKATDDDDKGSEWRLTA